MINTIKHSVTHVEADKITNLWVLQGLKLVRLLVNEALRVSYI